MAGRTPHQAVAEFVAPLRLALSCVTQEVAQAGGYHVADAPHALTLGRGRAIGLRGDAELSLTFAHRYRIVEEPGPLGPYRCSTASYLYALDDKDELEILSYQWHPDGHSTVTWPHLHLGAGAELGRSELVSAHLPTGWVSIEQVLRLAISELGVAPLRADWQDVLRDTESTHDDQRA